MGHQWIPMGGHTHKCTKCHGLEDFQYDGPPSPNRKVTVFTMADGKVTKQLMTCDEYQIYHLMAS